MGTRCIRTRTGACLCGGQIRGETILLAEKLGVNTVVDFSGCPGGSPSAKEPNWVTCPWPPEYLQILDWQWKEVATPFWKERAKFAADHGVRIAIEMHPGFLAYSPETLLRLREIAGPGKQAATMILATCSGRASIRLPPSACWVTRSSMFTRRTRRSTRRICCAPVLDTKPYTDEAHRGWISPHVRLWTWGRMVEGVRVHVADVRLRRRAVDRARRMSLMSPEEGLTRAVRFLERGGHQRKAGGGLVGLNWIWSMVVGTSANR